MMSRFDAIQEAKRRWGADAGVVKVDAQLEEFRVGYLVYPDTLNGPRFHIAGYGDSWESAFRDADVAEGKMIPISASVEESYIPLPAGAMAVFRCIQYCGCEQLVYIEADKETVVSLHKGCSPTSDTFRIFRIRFTKDGGSGVGTPAHSIQTFMGQLGEFLGFKIANAVDAFFDGHRSAGDLWK